MQPEVVIYSTPTCTYCNAAKRWFKDHGVTYTEHDVSRDPVKATEMYRLTGQGGGTGDPGRRAGDDRVRPPAAGQAPPRRRQHQRRRPDPAEAVIGDGGPVADAGEGRRAELAIGVPASWSDR